MALRSFFAILAVGLGHVIDQSKCDCCDEYTLHAYAGELNRHCFPAALLSERQDLILGEAGDGSPSVPQEALEILCASALCRSSVLRFWARVRGCSESSAWKRYGLAWAQAKLRCMRVEEAQYQVLMQATFARDVGGGTDSGTLEATASAVKEALQRSMQPPGGAALTLRVQLALAAYGPPVEPPMRFALATPETTRCPQLVTAFPWDGEVNVEPGLRYLVLHLDRCVQGTEATLLGRGSAAGRAEDGRGAGRRLAVLPALTEEMCSREVIRAVLPSGHTLPGRTLIFEPERPLSAGCCYRFHLDREAVKACNNQHSLCQDLKVDFCVEWPSPRPVGHLEEDRFFHIAFSVPVKLNETNAKVRLEAGPEQGDKVTAWFLPHPSDHTVWMTADGNLTHGQVADHSDGSGRLDGQTVYCAHKARGEAGNGQSCSDSRSFEVDLCSVATNCPDRKSLPCGMVLRAYFPAGLGISENVGSRQDTQSFRTRPCDPPHLLNSLRLSDDGETLYFSWSQPAEVAEPSAKISLCRAGGATRCFLEKTVADPEVTPCITGPDSCSEWSLDVRGLKACGQLSLQVEAGAVRALTHPLSSFAGLAQMTHPVPCGSGSLAYDEVPKLRCLELTDPVVLVPGQSNANFHGDLLAAHVVLQAADTRGAFLAALRKGPHTTPCAIVPKVAMKFWSGEERMIFEYVRKGGQLYSIGGHQNRALLEVFGLTAAHGHSGNLQFLQDMGGEADRKAEKCGFLPKLPVLNSMSSVKLGADARAHHFGQVVRGKGLYAAEETYSEYNSFGVVEVEVGHGVLDYFAFDWFDEVQEDRRPWAMQFALLAQCNAEHRPHVSAAPAQPQAWPGAPAAGGAPSVAAAAAAAYPVGAAGGQPFAPDQQPSADQYAQYAQPGRLLAEKEEHPELKALDAWEAASPVTGDPVEPDLEISIAMPCELQGEPNCEKVRQTMVQQLLEGSAFYETLQDGGIQLELSHFAPPHVIRVLSRCPPLEDIAEGLLYMNAACDFGAEGQDRFTSSTAFLRKHLIQSRLGVEVLTKELRHQVCRSPLCRGHVLHLRKKLEGCEDLGHEVHAASVSRIVGAVALGMESCLEVHSVVQGDATHGEVAGESGRAVGVWSSDMSEVNVVRLQGLDTGSPAEMRAVEHGARQILAKELKLPFFAFEERGGSFADVFDPLLGGPNVFVQDRNLRVAAQLTPLVSSEPFDEAVGLLEGEDLPIHQSPMYETQHNLQMLALQPAWGQQNVDPSSLRLRVIFEEIVTKDDLSAVIRVFPKALREICLSLQADDPLQWQRFPTQTGLGDLEPADGAQDPRDVESLPVGFLCHTISAGDESRVLASGEVLQLELRHPLLRNTEYVVQLPPRVVKAAMGSTRFPGALWAGWPADEGQGNKEYVFSTGLPLASNARLALAVSCGSEKECRRARKLLSETGMADLALRAKCYALWWRCHQDPIAPKHCERPSEMSWCDVGGSWSPSWAPPREEEEEEELSGVADQAVSEMQSITLPSWVYILALVAWVQGTFATLRGAWWVADLYVQSRDFDPFVAQGTRSLPLKVCAVAMGLPLLTGLLGALLAAPLFRLTARDNWRSGLGGSSAMVEAGRLHEQLAAAFTATICVSEACLAVLSYSVIARFKSWVADKGQLLAIFTLCCAGAGAAGSACGWVGASDLHQMNDPSEGLAWDVFVLLLSAGMAQTLSLALMPCAIFLLLCETPGIGDILSYALKFQAFQWRQWFEHGTGQGLWSEFVLLIADIEVDEGFISNMLDMGMDDGHLFIKFYCSATPHDVSATRSHAVRWEGDQSGAQTFDGEDIFVNFQDPLTLLRVDVMFQEETASRPECVATTIWDPWVTPLLDKYFENFKLCDARANHGSFWNPKDLFHSDGRPLDGVFLQLELNLTRHRTECIPEMGSLRFRATHLGGFGGARKSRSEPGVKPERLMALGDTIHGRDNIFNRRPIVEVQKCDFYDGKFRRSVEEEEEERKRMAHRQQLRHQLLHETSSPMSPHSVRSPQSQIYSPASSPLSMSPVSQMRQPLTGDTRDPRYPGGPMAGPPSPLPMRQSPRWVSPGASPARTLEPAPAVQSPASRSQGRREEGGQGLGDWLNDTLDSLGL